MVKKRVLVTGANGYIGRHVVKELLDNNFEVYAADFRFDGVRFARSSSDDGNI